MRDTETAKQYMDETYDYFMDSSKYGEKDVGQPWYEAFMSKHRELIKLVKLDDGEYVFRAWADQFKGRTMLDIAEEILGGEEPPFLPQWPAITSHQDWMKEHEPTGQGPFVAVMEYGATGEGQTIRVISAHAYSLPHFILHCGVRVSGYYFVIGMDFFDGVPKDNQLFNLVVPETALGFFHPQCNVDIDLKYHVNCS